MRDHPLDAPQITHNLFHVRKTVPNQQPDNNLIKDGTIPVDDAVELGYRLYIHKRESPVLLYFHGNGEIVTDYEGIAPLYHLCDLSVMVVDYRGYGWSTGVPLTTKMLPDAQTVLDALDDVLASYNFEPNRPLFVKGRSLGSAPAVYLAHQNPDKLKGLIIESGYADAPSLFRRLGIPIPPDVSDDITLPVFNATKMQNVHVPLLVMHGEQDTLIPPSNGRELYDASPMDDKKLVLIPNVGHNDILMATSTYFAAIREFVESHA